MAEIKANIRQRLLFKILDIILCLDAEDAADEVLNGGLFVPGVTSDSPSQGLTSHSSSPLTTNLASSQSTDLTLTVPQVAEHSRYGKPY